MVSDRRFREYTPSLRAVCSTLRPVSPTLRGVVPYGTESGWLPARRAYSSERSGAGSQTLYYFGLLFFLRKEMMLELLIDFARPPGDLTLFLPLEMNWSCYNSSMMHMKFIRRGGRVFKFLFQFPGR